MASFLQVSKKVLHHMYKNLVGDSSGGATTLQRAATRWLGTRGVESTFGVAAWWYIGADAG